MRLRKIYSEPGGLFTTVNFKDGVNFVYGKKLKGDNKKSLNSIGKTTFLDLIDFCLLSSFSKQHNKRLYKAKDILSGYDIVLEFQIDDIDYKVKRSVDNPYYVLFDPGDGSEPEKFKIRDLQQKFGNLIFSRKDYVGDFSSSWYRNLMLFYLKIQKFQKSKFLDPIIYIDKVNESKHNVLQFYLLNLDNSIPNKIYEHRTNEKGLKTTVAELRKFVAEKYGLTDTKETQGRIQKLKVDIKRFEEKIDDFKLGEQYEDAEQGADRLTETIKTHIYHNHIDKEKIKAYSDSLEAPDRLNMRRINSMYKEVTEDFAMKVEKTLTEAREFRKKLAKSRKDFISSEIKRLERIIDERIENIEKAEEERIKLFRFLATKEAITDLKEAYGMLSAKKTELSELESNSKTLFELERELNEILSEIAKLRLKAIDYINEIRNAISSFYELLSLVYSSIYIQYTEESHFTVTHSERKDSIIEIDLKVPDMFGKGKNQGRTLVYDLTILLTNIMATKNFPRFLVHDGIFDGVDKAHFVSVYKYIEELADKGNPIQYITTINEEGLLSEEKFGNSDIISPDKIEEGAILVLTPDDKLLGKDF